MFSIREERRDLFSVDESYQLAHCVSCDFRLGAGIAVEFSRRFPEIRKLQNHWEENISIGDVIWVNRAVNLVTKRRYFDKPTYADFERTLANLRAFCIEEKIDKLAMPKIGCGLDRLSWGNVKRLLVKHFQDTDIEILVCYL